nr:hypothetical protein [Tanacetum cinerariifolium]
RYIALPNCVHDALLESSSSKPQDDCITDVTKSSGNSNPTATSTNPPPDQLETLTVETPIPTVSSPVLTACFTDSPEPSSDTRLISKRVANQVETPSLDNILTLTNRFEDILGVTINLANSDGVEADNVWTLVDCLKGVRPIRTKWVLKNKKDERGIVIKNKARLVAQGHTQEEGIDYDKVFAPVARIEAIRLFLAYALFIGFAVYHMDVKSSFLYGTIDEECAPRAWYSTFSKYSLTNGFKRGTIDQTLFIRRQRGDFILVQVYVNDIIFGSLNPQLCREFEALMHEKFQMSAMGDILKKFGYSYVRSSNTPIDKENPWGKVKIGKDVDLHLYRSMIGSLMYLTASRPDIMFAICACVRHQVTPKECHLHVVKRIFRYLKGHLKLGLWLISWQCKKQTIVATSTTEEEYVTAAMQIFPLLGKLSTVNVFLGFRLTFSGTSKYWGVLRILMISLRLIPLVPQGEGSGTPTEPHHIPSPETQQTYSTTLLSPTLPPFTTAPIPTVTSSNTPTLRQYTRRARIAQSSALPPIADEPASPLRDVSQGEACPTNSGFGADQDMANIAKTSTLPHDSAPRVTSPAIDEGTQELEINKLKDIVKLLEDREGVAAERSKDDAAIKGRNLDEREASAKRVSDDTEEMATVLTSMDAATVLASGVAEIPTGSRSIPTVGPPATEVTTGSDVVPTAGLIFATATVVTPYTRRKGKETMVESETLKKKIQEQMDIQMARQLKEEMERDAQRMNKQIAQDAEIARIHAEEELQSMIDGLDKSNETVAKYLQEYHQFASKLPLERRIELIENFIPMGSKEEVKRFKRKGIRFKQESVKKLKTLEEVPEEVKSPDEVPKEKVKEMMQLVPIKEVKVLNKLWALVKESLSIRPPTSDKEMELWVELKRLYEPDDEDQLQTHTQNLMHASIEWKLYDTCRVHHVTAKDKEIFMLVEKDYPLKKGLAIGMISYKLQVENYSEMANNLILKIYKIARRIVRNKMHKAFPLPVIEFPLAEEVPTASEESCHCQKKRVVTVVKIALLLKFRRNCQSMSNDSYAKLLEVDATEDFKENMLRDYNCWLKTHCCPCKLKLLVDAADTKLRLLEQSDAVVQIVSAVQIVKTVSIRVNTVMYKLRLLVSAA